MTDAVRSSCFEAWHLQRETARKSWGVLRGVGGKGGETETRSYILWVFFFFLILQFDSGSKMKVIQKLFFS